MRVNCKKSFNQLVRLRLDQSSFRLARLLIHLTEKLSGLYQDLTFLRRCKKHHVLPDCITRSIKPVFNIHQTVSLQNTLERAKKGLLTQLIRDKYRSIFLTKREIGEINNRCPDSLLRQIDPLLQTARIWTKSRRKRTLKAKFNRLQAPTTANNEDITLPAPTDRVTILDDIPVPDEALSLLSKGPRFSLSSTPSREQLQHTMQVEMAALAYSLRWRATHARSARPTDTSLTATIFRHCPFHNDRKEPPRVCLSTEKTIQGLQMDIQRLVEHFDITKLKRNVTRKETTALRNLCSRDDTTITRSDKGGELVVLSTSHIQRLCLEHLSDTTTYKKLKKDPTSNTRKKINTTVRQILSRCNFPDNLIRRLETPSTARTQQFYALPKTHKPTLKIRPIVSACRGIFDRLGWFLQQILKPLVRLVPAHLNNTADLIARFEAIAPEDLINKIPVSFDVVSLYTNIDTEEAIDTTLQYTIKHQLDLCGLETSDIHDLLHLLLDNNVFQYENHGYYQQVRGLAMGNRLSGTLAIICMDRFERSYVYCGELRPKPVIYVRYVDDIGTVVDNTADAHALLCYLNSKHKTIQFEMEVPDVDGFLPILDVQIRINADGRIERKLFTKKASKRIILHFESHLATSTKQAVAANELRRSLESSSHEHRKNALTQARVKLINNGYPPNLIDHLVESIQRPKNVCSKPQRSRDQLILKFPFVSDNFNYAMKRILARYDLPVRIVNYRGQTLREFTKRQAVKPSACKSKQCPAPGICQRSSVVYLATCLLCDATYVGMTTRTLHERATEHIGSARRGDANSAFGDHYEDHHAGTAPSIRFEIVSRHRDHLHLHIEEALAIKRLKPTLNRREETMGTGFLI